MRRLLLWIPLAVFLVFVVTAAVGLYSPSESTIRSRLVGKEVPDFVLPPMLPQREGLADEHLRAGKPRLVNVFASWCGPCIAEAPHLEALARRGIPIDAIAIRDRPEDVAKFLRQHGDPYKRIGSDRDSNVQLALGSSGVPETFVIDGRGVIRHQHIGDIRPEHVADIVRAYENAK